MWPAFMRDHRCRMIIGALCDVYQTLAFSLFIGARGVTRELLDLFVQRIAVDAQPLGPP